MVPDTLISKNASTHQIWDSYLKCRKIAPDTIILERRPKVKASDQKWYVAVGHPKMHLHTELGILPQIIKGDMARTQKCD